MTDKEKIRAEIDRLHSKWMFVSTTEGYYKCKLCNQLLKFIDSLQEEPISEGKDIFDNYLKSEEKFILPQKISGNIDCENCLYSSACALGDIKACIIDTPVSEDLEDASRNYADNEEYGDDVYFGIKVAFEAGAQWQKQQDAKILKSVITNGKNYPTLDSFLNTFKMMQYGKIKM